MKNKKEKKILSQRPAWGQAYMWVDDDRIHIERYTAYERIKEMEFTFGEAKSLLEHLPGMIAQVEMYLKKEEEEE